MYVGRFLVVAPTVGAYRVSSRSFPNRHAIAHDDRVTIKPTPDAPETDNPYISYNCLRVTPHGTVIGNGAHVDPIAEKIALGYPARDALATALLALDFEKDDYDTPRIAGVVGAHETGRDSSQTAFVATVRRDALIVESVSEPTLVATYEKDTPELFGLEETTAKGAAQTLFDHEFEHAVCAAGVSLSDTGVDIATVNR